MLSNGEVNTATKNAFALMPALQKQLAIGGVQEHIAAGNKRKQ
jgi:hypothetical protein